MTKLANFGIGSVNADEFMRIYTTQTSSTSTALRTNEWLDGQWGAVRVKCTHGSF